MIKSELRRIYLAKQRALATDERDKASKLIAENVFANFDLASTRTLHCFLTIDQFNEIDTTPIIHTLWRDHPQVRVAVPRVNFESGEMESIRYTADSETDRNRWLIPEPIEGEIIGSTEIDMVLVPGLCFDLDGHRVGYGKGFYDRFLKECRPDCLTVGLSYFDPVEKIDGVHTGDVRLGHVVTPERLYRSVPPG